MNEQDAKHLQSLLRTSILGKEGYERLICDVKSDAITQLFRRYGNDYEEFSEELNSIMQDNGFTPKNTSGWAGKMAEMGYNMMNLQEAGTLRMLESAYKGELQGIEKATELYARTEDPEAKKTDCAKSRRFKNADGRTDENNPHLSERRIK